MVINPVSIGAISKPIVQVDTIRGTIRCFWHSWTTVQFCVLSHGWFAISVQVSKASRRLKQLESNLQMITGCSRLFPKIDGFSKFPYKHWGTPYDIWQEPTAAIHGSSFAPVRPLATVCSTGATGWSWCDLVWICDAACTIRRRSRVMVDSG